MVENSILNKVMVVIPSLNPDDMLLKYYSELRKIGFHNIIVVNDGSTSNLSIYDEIEKVGGVVLKHAVNQGKGRALKTAYNYVLNNYSEEDIYGVVTADADGQHTPGDTYAIARCLINNINAIVLGVRDFSSSNVPPKSKYGNKLTALVFAMLYGKYIIDTQTGLRGIPYSYLENSMKCKGERFEYEIQVLIDMVVSKHNIIQTKIDTVYYDGNRETHFDAVKDSFRIYKVILERGFRYAFASLSSWVIDIVLFSILVLVIKNVIVSKQILVLVGTVLARVASALYNFVINKKMVFKSKTGPKKSLVRYMILAISQMMLSWLLVSGVYIRTNINVSIIKIMVDVILFVVSYNIQRGWVFNDEN